MASPLASLPATSTPRDLAAALGPPGTSPLAQLLGDLDSRPVHVIPFPGFYGEDAPMVALWALTDEEGRAASLLAHAYCTVTRKLSADTAERLGMLASENRARLLQAAMRRPEAPAFPFASPGEAGANEVRRLTPDVQDALMLEYLQHLDARSPLRRLQADGLNAQVEELVTELGKGVPASVLISSYDTGTLRLLVEFLLRRVAGIRDNFSDSSAPNDGPSNSSAPSADGSTGPGEAAGPVDPDPDADAAVIDLRGG